MAEIAIQILQSTSHLVKFFEQRNQHLLINWAALISLPFRPISISYFIFMNVIAWGPQVTFNKSTTYVQSLKLQLIKSYKKYEPSFLRQWFRYSNKKFGTIRQSCVMRIISNPWFISWWILVPYRK